MEIDIRGKNIKITDGIRDHAVRKIGKLEKYSLKIEAIHVIFSVQKISQQCEIILLGKDMRMTATEHTEDMYASMDMAVASLEKQLSRYHEKIKHHREEKAVPEVEESAEESDAGGDDQ